MKLAKANSDLRATNNMAEDPSQPETNLTTYALSNQGRVRPNNEDWVDGFIPTNNDDLQKSGCLFIVADGVGGAQKGELASRFAVRNVLYEYYHNPDGNPSERLAEIIQTTGNKIYEYSVEKGLRMATTMVAAVIQGNKLTVANVGDSRAYLIRDSKATQITRDHNRAGELVRMGALSLEEARVSSTRKTLTRSLGGKPDEEVDLFNNILLKEGDVLLLCSDGLTEYATSEDIARLVSNPSLEEAANSLVDFANDSDGSDNITLYLIMYGKPDETYEPGLARSLPTPADWDEVNTLPFIEPKRRKASSIQKTLNKSYIPILLAAFAILSIGGIFALSLSRREQGESTQVPGSIGTERVNITESTVITLLPTITAIPNIPMANMTQTESIIEPTSNFPPTHTSIPIQELTPTADRVQVCVHKVESGENYSAILLKNNTEDPDYPLAQKFIPIDCFEESLVCTGQAIEFNADINQIYPLEYLILPGVTVDRCSKTENNYWVTIISNQQ